MFSTTRVLNVVLGGITAVALLAGTGLAVAVAGATGDGAGPSADLVVQSAAAPRAAVEPAAADGAVEEATPDPEAPTTTQAPPTTAARSTTVAPTTRPPATAPPSTPAPVTAPPPTAPPTTVPALAPRVQPTSAQVQEAIRGISSRVSLPLFFQITPAYVAQFGDQVCDAFDAGQTFAQVKATGLAAAAQFVTVTPEAADYAVRTAVAMYCPAYQSRLV